MNTVSFFPVFACITGLILGSFYTVCIHRALTGESLVRPARSYCPHCRHVLAWWENIPLVSYLLLHGRCRHCKQGISLRYFAVELLSGLVALVLALKFGWGAKWCVYMAFCGLFIVQSALDLATMSMLLYPLIAGAGAALVCAPVFLDIPLSEALLAAGAGAGVFWLIRVCYLRFRGIEGLGEGDIWLMLVIGPLVGVKLLPLVVLISAVSLLLCSVFLLQRNAVHKKQEDGQPGILQTPVPYGPFLCGAAVVTLLTGNEIMHWYLF